MGDPVPGLDITINPCTCSLCVSAVKAGGKPIHGPKDAGFIKVDDEEKSVSPNEDEWEDDVGRKYRRVLLQQGKAPPAIPPDPDIEKETGPKGINTPNLLKGLWRDRADGGARGIGKKLAGISLAIAIVAAAAGLGLFFWKGMTNGPFDTQVASISLNVTLEGSSWVITFKSVPEGMATESVVLLISRETGEKFSAVRLADFTRTAAGTGTALIFADYFQQAPSENIAVGDKILLSAVMYTGSTFQLVLVELNQPRIVLAEGTVVGGDTAVNGGD